MKKTLFILLFLTVKAYTQDLKVISFEQFEQLTKPQNDKIYLINFWATYCKPCIVEMPHFQQVAAESDGKIEVIFVSLDFVKDTSKVKDFINQRQIKQQVVLLNEPDYDSWINRVSQKWSGALPATLILNKSKREFYEQSFDYQGLMKVLGEFEE
jgi:thiol-disulfide isomerase/thioredoxin